MKLEFTFKAVASARDSKTTVIAITSITTEEGISYAIPSESIYSNYHEKLIETSEYKKVKKSLEKRGDVISVWIVLSTELQQEYIDETGNMQFGGKYLKKIGKEEIGTGTELSRILEKLIEQSEKKEEEMNLKHIMDKFIIEKFNNKRTNVSLWIDTFEKECTRFKIQKDNTKIELLRLLLDETCKNWYSSRTLKQEYNDDWSTWKRALIETFSNRGWNNIMYAHNYRYKEGSLMDYAIKKERLLLEINEKEYEDTLIDRIGAGLPDFIREKINRDELKSTRDLINELQKYEGKIEKKKYSNQNYKPRNEEKKPCKTCETMGKGIRYHPENKCWFQTDKREEPKITKSNTVIEVDLNTEQKNA